MEGLGLSAADYLDAEKKLLPKGPAWEVDDTFFEKTLTLAALEFARVDGDILKLVDESDPRTASITLRDWFHQWGIPDECLKALTDADLETFRRVLITKITTQGYTFEQFVYLIGQTLGYTSTSVGTYDPFTVSSFVNQRLCDDEWKRWFMTITADSTNVKYFIASSRVDNPLALWGDQLFECLVKSLAPAHLGVIFQYGK